MKATELRIGNYVHDTVSGEWMRVEELKGEDIENDDSIVAKIINRDKYPLPKGWQMAPIPLTPDILQKAGFEESHFFEGVHSGVYNKNGLKIGLDGDDLVKAQYTAIFLGDIFVKVQYLHQLQNLYFALTGEELTINL